MTTKAIFPAVCHRYVVDFGGDNAFYIHFKSYAAVVFTKLAEPNKGIMEVVKFTFKPIRDGSFFNCFSKLKRVS
ncbi:hypothetical protein M8994_13685 [Brucella sp. 21LCYQ03]|nr:hypothetical protein [Brucella sp. 21LCYQ03]